MKIYALLKRYLLALTLLFATSIISYSCKKESSPVNASIDNAKAWYELVNRGKLFALKSTKNGTLMGRFGGYSILSTNERSEIQNLMDMHRKSNAANLRHGSYCN